MGDFQSLYEVLLTATKATATGLTAERVVARVYGPKHGATEAAAAKDQSVWATAGKGEYVHQISHSHRVRYKA